MKRPVLYLLAGIVCAAVAVFLANKYLSQRAAGGGKENLSSILIATRSIEFGTKLDLGEKDRPGNVAIVSWPGNLVPEGAITSAEQIKGKDLVAAAPFVRHQHIQEALVKPESEFIPSDSYLEPFTVERDLLASLRAGMKVDVLKLYEDKSEKTVKTEKIIKCALICAVGELPSAVEKSATKGEQPKAKEIAPTVYLLLPRKYSELVVEARQQAKLTVRPADGPCAAGPEATLPEERPKPLKVAEELMKVADSLRSQARFEAAIAVYEQLVAAYAESPEAKGADKARQECELALAEQLYHSAEEALAKKDFLACLNMCEQIEKAHPTAKETIKKLSRSKPSPRRAEKSGSEKLPIGTWLISCRRPPNRGISRRRSSSWRN